MAITGLLTSLLTAPLISWGCSTGHCKLKGTCPEPSGADARIEKKSPPTLARRVRCSCRGALYRSLLSDRYLVTLLVTEEKGRKQSFVGFRSSTQPTWLERDKKRKINPSPFLMRQCALIRAGLIGDPGGLPLVSRWCERERKDDKLSMPKKWLK